MKKVISIFFVIFFMIIFQNYNLKGEKRKNNQKLTKKEIKKIIKENLFNKKRINLKKLVKKLCSKRNNILPILYSIFSSLEKEKNKKKMLCLIMYIGICYNKKKVCKNTLDLISDNLEKINKSIFRLIFKILIKYRKDDISYKCTKLLSLYPLPNFKEKEAKNILKKIELILFSKNISYKNKINLIKIISKFAIYNNKEIYKISLDILKKMINSPDIPLVLKKQCLLSLANFSIEDIRELVYYILENQKSLYKEALETLYLKRDIKSIPFLIELLDEYSDEEKIIEKIISTLKKIAVVKSKFIKTPKDWEEWFETQKKIKEILSDLIYSEEEKDKFKALFLLKNYVFISKDIINFIINCLIEENKELRKEAIKLIKILSTRFTFLDFLSPIKNILQSEDLSEEVKKDLKHLLKYLDYIK